MTASSPQPKNALRLVFFGSGAFGLPTLKHLASTHQIEAVVTQPHRPAGRKRALTPTPIGAWAAEHLPSVPLLKPENVNEADQLDLVRSFDVGSPDERRGGWVVIAFGQKLSKRLLADRFAINLHASLLPRWRGAAPINHAILAGDSVTGNSVITLADRMDAGLVLGQSERPITLEATAGELHDQLAGDGPPLVDRVLREFASGQLRPAEQDDSKVTIAGKLDKGLGAVDLSEISAEVARRTIHALNPWPSVTVEFRGESLKLLRAVAEPGTTKQRAGTIVDAEIGTVACGERTVLRLVEVQPAGRKPMPYGAFANGAKPRAGESLDPILPARRAR